MSDAEVAISPEVATPKKAEKKSRVKKTVAAKKPATKATTHPPTSEMVYAAIAALKDRKGSSLQAIKKYIAATYKVNLVKQSFFIKKFLKSEVEKKSIVQTKGTGASGRFKLAAKVPGEKKKVAKRPVAKKPAVKKAAVKKATGEKKVAAAKKSAAKKAVIATKKPTAANKKSAGAKRSAATKKAAVAKTAKPAEAKSPVKAKKSAKTSVSKETTRRLKHKLILTALFLFSFLHVILQY